MSSDVDDGLSETSPRRPTMTRDLIWATMTSAAILIGNVILTSLLAHRGAADVFGPYQLAKRIGASAMPLLSVGLNVGVVRFIAGAVEQKDRDRHTVLGVFISFAVPITGTLVLLIAPSTFARLLLGSTDVPLMWAMWVYTIALTFNTMVYSFYRADFKQTKANWNTLIAMTLGPVLVVGLAPSSWNAVLLLSSVSSVVIAWNGAQLLMRLWRSLGTRPSRSYLVDGARTLIPYSISRVPGSVAMNLVNVVGPLVATQAGAALAASYVLAGMTIVQVAGASMQAFGVVLMPRVAELSAQGKDDSIVSVCRRLIYIGIAMSALMVPLLLIVTPDIVQVWLGSEFSGSVLAMRMIVIGIPAQLLIMVLRGMLDATIKQPVVTYAAVGGLIACAVMSVLVPADSAAALSLAFTFGQSVMAAVMFIVIAAKFRPRFHWQAHLVITAAACVLGFAAYFLGGLAGDMVHLARSVLAVAFGAVGLVAAVWYAPEDTGLRDRVRRVLRLGR